MGRFLWAILIWMAAAGPAVCGAWLRETETGFKSLSVTARQTAAGRETEFGLYAEYGFRSRLTVGLDVNDRARLGGHALAFLRMPLVRRRGRLSTALDVAAGGHYLAGPWMPMLRVTASAGLGFATRWGNGWANVDAGYERRLGTGGPAWKLDTTLGLSSGPRLRPMLQLETYYRRGQPLLWTLTPSVLFDARRGRTWVIGIEYAPPPGNSTGLKIALWKQF